MPTSYEFLTFSDVNSMRDASTKGRIRKHAMKDIGVSRRGPRRRRTEVVFELKPIAMRPLESPEEDHLPIADDRALYDPSVRAMSCKMDPFDAASIPIDSTVNGLLKYFVHYSSNPNNFTFSPSINELIASAFQDELLIHCILSAAASRIHYVQGLALPVFVEREAASTQQSLTLLQCRLKEGSSQYAASTERLVNCMLYLCAGAIYRHDLAIAKVHIDAAVKIVEQIGGVTKLQDHQVLVRVLSLDDLLSCVEMIPCRVKRRTYDPGPLTMLEGEERMSGVEKLADGFRVADYAVLPTPLRILAIQVLECCHVKRGLELYDTPFSPEALRTRHWLKLRSLAARNGLLAFATSDARTNVIRIVLIMCTLLPPSDLRQIKTAQVVARKLRGILEQGMEPSWEGNEEIELWCMLIAYSCAESGSNTRTWFAEQIYNLICVGCAAVGIGIGPGLSSDLMAFQGRFLCTQPELKPPMEELAEYILLWDDSHLV